MSFQAIWLGLKWLDINMKNLKGVGYFFLFSKFPSNKVGLLFSEYLSSSMSSVNQVFAKSKIESKNFKNCLSLDRKDEHWKSFFAHFMLSEKNSPFWSDREFGSKLRPRNIYLAMSSFCVHAFAIAKDKIKISARKFLSDFLTGREREFLAKKMDKSVSIKSE